MNSVLELIHHRKSVRVYEDKKIDQETKEAILLAAMRSPTAGNLMLYSIIEVTDQAAKDTLAKTCDNQPFIARAPLVLLFLADYQRWVDYFVVSDVEQICQEKAVRKPQEGDLFLACCDALIAAQTSVIAAESLGVGSCYIGDIMENYEIHRDLFDLPQYVFPITLICFGYPTEQQKKRELTPRFSPQFIHFEDRYQRLDAEGFTEMFKETHQRVFGEKAQVGDARNLGQLMYLRKFGSEFADEMNRSVRAILQRWTGDE